MPMLPLDRAAAPAHKQIHREGLARLCLHLLDYIPQRSGGKIACAQLSQARPLRQRQPLARG